ncbi:hypothetical protein TNCV_1824151 [Trichonephila clavipes]|nr:hypothetical protein TNCV_1824151 [Trichonephila clavipes]
MFLISSIPDYILVSLGVSSTRFLQTFSCSVNVSSNEGGRSKSVGSLIVNLVVPSISGYMERELSVEVRGDLSGLRIRLEFLGLSVESICFSCGPLSVLLNVVVCSAGLKYKLFSRPKLKHVVLTTKFVLGAFIMHVLTLATLGPFFSVFLSLLFLAADYQLILRRRYHSRDRSHCISSTTNQKAPSRKRGR